MRNPRYFVFAVLPFGISTAGYIFSKVLKEVVKNFRSEGKQIIMFLDDGLGGEANFEAALQSSKEVKVQLEKLGFLIAHDKCHWFPCQHLRWLGYTWDTKNGTIVVNDERIEKLEKYIEYALRQASNGKVLFRARFLASIVGQLISMQTVFGDKVRMYTRYLYDCVLGMASWKACVKLDQAALNELLFWNANCRDLNSVGAKISKVNIDQIFDCDIFCDASDVGFGGFISTCVDAQFESNEKFGTWTEVEKNESSTWRELECVNRVLNTYSNAISHKQIRVNSDNKNVKHILKVGSRNMKLQSIATSIHSLCTTNVEITTKWVPRIQNNYADNLSRFIDHDE